MTSNRQNSITSDQIFAKKNARKDNENEKHKNIKLLRQI